MEKLEQRSRRIWLLSDLHQEFLRDPVYGSDALTRFDPTRVAPNDFDVVVLAGDIDVPLSRSIDWAAERFAGVPIVYVPGNHDFYVAPGDSSLTLDELQSNGREAAAHIAEARGSRGMNDYKSIKRWSTKQPGKRKSLRPEDTIAAHFDTRRFLSARLEEQPARTTVVVTHHAPLAESVDVNKRLSWCYASRMEYLFDGDFGPDLWLHGHIHDPVDYQRGTTRIVSNPRGYAFPERQYRREFDPALVLEVTIRATDQPHR
ncbi:metallophosphoesterase [Devosia sp. CN2-171]|uniref:metallophosphoesterase n=1 Tax=Devosia sp. CN2-171 TaxID=3400909 RepID=UPI003BF82F6C